MSFNRKNKINHYFLYIKVKLIFFDRSSLDEDEAFLTTADSAVKLLPKATWKVAGWKGLEYKAAFPLEKPLGANFYPPDMDKMVISSCVTILL